jgi:myosin heavy subunit
MDEKTPHMHVSFVPITEDGRLSAKEIVGNKKKLTEWQDGFWQHMAEKYPDLERGKSASITGRTHIPPRLFKEAEHLDKQLRGILAIMDETHALNAKKNVEEIRKRLKKLFPKLTKFKETLSGYEKAYKELQKENASLTSRVEKLAADKEALSKQVKEKKLTERLTAKQLEADYQNLYRRVSRYAPELLRGLPDPQKKKELSL